MRFPLLAIADIHQGRHLLSMTHRRPVPEPPQRQRVAHACFHCRKSWKLPPGKDGICPQCARPLSEMGRSFKAPKMGDLKQWEKVQRLWDSGFRFSSLGHGGDGERFPDKLREVDDFIRRNPDHPWRVRD